MRVRLCAALAASASLIAITASAQEIVLDTISVTTTKTGDKVIDTLGGANVRTRSDIERIQADSVSDILRDVPGVTTTENPNDPAQSINIRGLQDFGRVNVLVDGARQNYQTTGHSANGTFYLDPEFIGAVDITRGPVSTVYGSGAIGGVALFRTTTIDDILAPDERFGFRQKVGLSSNGPGVVNSTAAGVRAGSTADLFGQFVYRKSGEYQDGLGFTVPDTDRELIGGLGKINVRPAEGHEISATGMRQQFDFTNNGGTGTGTRFRHNVDTQTYTLGYRFARPETPLVDFNAKAYYTTTSDDQTVVRPTSTFASLGAVPGSLRSFNIDTLGVDLFNTSRFSTLDIDHALTVGVDAFEDTVKVTDRAGGFGTAFTPSGSRRVAGGFIQNEARYGGVLRVIGALRFDDYQLESPDFEADGGRISPKVTVGVSPFGPGVEFYATYAEGFRAPALSETLVSGIHPFPQFQIRPNPALRPEVAHNIEGGVNLKYGDVFTPGDIFRAKATVFHNTVEDYIDTVSLPGTIPFRPAGYPIFLPPLFLPDVQFQNIAEAELRGFELEATYDWVRGFVTLSGTLIESENVETGQTLVTAPPDRVGGTLGLRFLEGERLVVGTRLWLVDGKRVPSDLSGVFESSKPYGLVDLFASYRHNEWVRGDFIVENLFDKRYQKYLDSDASPGLTAKLALTIRFASR